MVPSASTASIPTSCCRMAPYRSTFTPPALVATIPPTVAESRDPMSTPNAQPDLRTCFWSAPRVVPAPTVTSPATSSTGSVTRRRSVDRTSCGRGEPRSSRGAAARGTPPPTSPVLPPCGTTAAPTSPQARSTVATSSRVPGLTTAAATP